MLPYSEAVRDMIRGNSVDVSARWVICRAHAPLSNVNIPSVRALFLADFLFRLCTP